MSEETTPQRRRAVALEYDVQSGSAPRVVAAGQGTLAEKIIELARQAGVPMSENSALAQALVKVPPGQEIPVEAYRAVAEIIELVGDAALPVVDALDKPIPRDQVARAARPALEELCERTDLPRELHAWARSALIAVRGVILGDAPAYASFLRAMHEILVLAGLPAPCELAADDDS